MQNVDRLSTATVAVFPGVTHSARNEDCVFPLKLLRYGDADVLLTANNAPGEVCHGCSASLSAYVLVRKPEKYGVVARFVDFTASGTFGSAGDIDAIQFAGHDAFVIESGGTFQGYSSISLSMFVLRDKKLDAIAPDLPLDASTEGALGDDKATSVDGAWRVDPGKPDAITIDYVTKAEGRTTPSSATWVLEAGKFALRGGAIPAGYASASGQ